MGAGIAAGPSVAVDMMTLLPPPYFPTCLLAPLPLPSPLHLQDDRTPLHLAASNDHLESVRLLLDRGADKEAKLKVR